MDLPKLLTFEDIEAARAEKRISKAALCRRAGVHQTTYNRWHRKHFKPGSDSMRKLHEALYGLVKELADADA